MSVLKLDVEWEEMPERNEIKRVAFHEVCELLLASLGWMAKERFNSDEVDEKIHEIIRRLENTIFKEKRK